MSLAFYISGHGYGHASRQIEIINAIARAAPSLPVLIRSAAERRLFDRTVNAAFELDSRPCDTGVVQIDSLRLDAAATIDRAAAFYRTLDARAAEEAGLLRSRGVRFVVSDAPPLACAAAARAGIPSVVVSNFTWDWIYAEYREYLDAAPALIPSIQAAYHLATEAWRLPMHGGFDTFRTRVIDTPFVARHAAYAPAETRLRLGLPLDRKLALPSFGGYGVNGVDLDSLDLDRSWHLVRVPDAAIYDAGLRYVDLVKAVDVVVTKPGYGIISECIANGTALVYTPRGRFAEYPVLVREMPRYVRCAFLNNESLLAGRWRGALDAAVAAPPPPVSPRTDGAEVIADMIAALVSSA